MASHYRLKRAQIWDSGAMASTNTITSDVIEIINLDNVCLQLDVSGTPNGTFDIQVSTDHLEDQEGNVINAGNWVSVPISGSLTVSGSAISIMADLTQLGASYLRVQYTNTSSTGTVNAYVSGKGLM